MRTKLVAILLLSFLTLPLRAELDQELLRAVDAAQSRRLEEYNAVFLQGELYFASRHRLVVANTDLLLRGSDITVTPFEDVAPIRIINTDIHRNGEDIVHWLGRMADDPLFELLGETPLGVTISAHAWDRDDAGSASPSSRNRFQFSPLWVFDERDNPILRAPTDGNSATIAFTGPPRTAGEIARHKELQGLDKHAFFSTSAVIAGPNGNTYVLKPLKFTPRYSVIYEIPADTAFPLRADLGPGQQDMRSDLERIRAAQYSDFLNALPDEAQKQVRGDVR